METYRDIDTTFDFRSDTPQGKDPDAFSPTLRRYHKILWSKTLPSGAVFRLDDSTPHVYLHHRSELGEFFLASDTVIPSFWKEPRLAHIIDAVNSKEKNTFNRFSYTIGGMMVFPGNRIDGMMTINGARGMHPRIKDRFDLTIECVRRHYCNEESPLSDVIQRYSDFFDIFHDFRGYVDFFLLQDLVTVDYSAMKFFLPFEGFQPFPFPKNTEEYRSYLRFAVDFINSRNHRILHFDS
jgi:hypothetical protein